MVGFPLHPLAELHDNYQDLYQLGEIEAERRNDYALEVGVDNIPPNPNGALLAQIRADCDRLEAWRDANRPQPTTPSTTPIEVGDDDIPF